MPFFASNPNWDAKQCDVQSIKPSPSGKLLAYCVDGSGYETYDVRLKDLESGADLEEMIGDTAGNIAWAGDGTLFYTRQDKAHRAYQVWRHALGTNSKQDEMVYEDPDELFNVVRSSAAIPALWAPVWSDGTSSVPNMGTDVPNMVRWHVLLLT